jgi:hypothetical protein
MHQYLTAMHTVEAWSPCLERPTEAGAKKKQVRNMETKWSGKKTET